MAKQRKIVILGGALSGPTAAARARETDERAKIIVIERAAAISYAVGGLPYYLSGEVDARGDLAPYKAAFFRQHYEVEVRTKVSVERFDPDKRKVYTSAGVVAYDALIYALGAGSVLPEVFGEGASNLSFLRNPADLAKIDRALQKGARRVAIVGGGFYGVEAADCLARRGDVEVTLIERGVQLLPEFSPAAAGRAARELEAAGVRVMLGAEVEALARKGKRIAALETSAGRVETDFVIITAGVRPRTEIFAAAGGRIQRDGSIRIDERCATNLDEVYATSICTSHTHAVTRKAIWTAQASDADSTAQVAGANAAGGQTQLEPTLATSIIRAGALDLARTGLTELGGKFDARRIQVAGHSCDPFFRGSAALDVTLYYAPATERVLGAEVVGRAGVDKRIDVLATAIFAKLRLPQLAQLDLAYSPPYSTTRDLVNVAATVASQAQDIRAWDRDAFTARPDEVLVLDIRPAGVRKRHRFEAEAVDLAKLSTMRRALRKTAQVVFVCETGRESYLAARKAKQLGAREAGYLSGGLAAWRDARDA